MRAHNSRSVTLTLFALALGMTGCASGSGGGGGSGSTGGSANHIVQAELAEVPQLDAYQAIQRLRARWLRSRSGVEPALFVDGARRSAGLEDLRSISAEQVEEMRYLSASDATNRYGTDMMGGAILVTTRR